MDGLPVMTNQVGDPGPEERHEGGEEILKNLIRLTVGLGSAVLSALPTAIEEGERIISQQSQTAEMVGKMAVTYLKHSYGTKVESGVQNLMSNLGLFKRPQGEGSSSEGAEAVARPSRVQEARADGDGSVGTIADYDLLTAAQIISKLPHGDAELAEIEKYELANRRRRTILNRLSEIRESRISPQG